MKKTIIILCVVLLSTLTKAQIQTTDSIHYNVEEGYLANLFRHADVIFSKIDNVEDYGYIKNMEVAFTVDSCPFRTAYIESNFYYDATISAFYPLWCTYVKLDDSQGNSMTLVYQEAFTSLDVNQDPLNNLSILRPVLDSLIQHTDTIDYTRGTNIVLEVDQ